MAKYYLTQFGGVMREDGAGIPDAIGNKDRQEYEDWLKAGSVPDPYEPQPEPPRTVLPQDLMALLTADDAAKIRTAVESNAQLWLLWSAMQAQKDPMQVTNARFLAGWNALVQVLGADRMAAIGATLGVTV